MLSFHHVQDSNHLKFLPAEITVWVVFIFIVCVCRTLLYVQDAQEVMGFSLHFLTMPR